MKGIFNSLALSSTCLVIAILFSCKKNNDQKPIKGTVTDIDGNGYDTITIGTQIWMKENLKVSKYRNGDPIITGLSNKQWADTTGGAYVIYENNPVNNDSYGKLYNWFAVIDPRGLCPAGWHVPSDEEWKTLEIGMGMPVSELDQVGWRAANQNVGGKLKATSNLWFLPNTGATDESGFSGLPGGNRHPFLGFGEIAGSSYWWTTSETSTYNSLYRRFNYDKGSSKRDSIPKIYGLSVRCVKD